MDSERPWAGGRAEAADIVGGRFDVRVLEPSPPAVDDGAWYADDPVAPEPRRAGLPLLSPVHNGDVTWDELTQQEPALAQWCADRWLGAWAPLAPIGDSAAFTGTRQVWHAIAEQVLAPARRAVNGKIGLRATHRGVGTPFYGRDEQARIDGSSIVVVRDGIERRRDVTTLAAAAELVGVEPGAPSDLYKPETTVALDAPLAIDPHAARVLGDWFGFASSVLEELRAEAGADDTRAQLWPEHLDLSIDLGDEVAGTRGTFGASPGDAQHPEPYWYVTHWNPDVPADSFWNETAFAGASLTYLELLAAGDQREHALAFLRRGVDVLGARRA
jgi:hypothetical protein